MTAGVLLQGRCHRRLEAGDLRAQGGQNGGLGLSGDCGCEPLVGRQEGCGARDVLCTGLVCFEEHLTQADGKGGDVRALDGERSTLLMSGCRDDVGGEGVYRHRRFRSGFATHPGCRHGDGCRCEHRGIAFHHQVPADQRGSGSRSSSRHRLVPDGVRAGFETIDERCAGVVPPCRRPPGRLI